MENRPTHYILNLSNHGDERGSLVVIEAQKSFPFDIKRLFFEYDTDTNSIRGQHANRNSRFGFVSLKGSCKVLVKDNGRTHKYFLDSPTKMLIIDKLIWKDMIDFSEDNILLVISDSYYDSNEYIRDFDEYLAVKKQMEDNL